VKECVDLGRFGLHGLARISDQMASERRIVIIRALGATGKRSRFVLS
jgi:hypothetical protein